MEKRTWTGMMFLLQTRLGRIPWLCVLVASFVLLLFVLQGQFCSAAIVSDPDWLGTAPRMLSTYLQAGWPDVAAGDTGQVIVVWRDKAAAQPFYDIHTVHSQNFGVTWSVSSVLSPTLAQSTLPDALIVGERVFVAWTDQSTGPMGPSYTIYAGESTTGDSWLTESIPGSTSPASSRAHLVANQDRLYVLFNAGDEIKPDVLWASRSLSETNWTTAMVAYTHTATSGAFYPVSATSLDGQVLHVVWEERRAMDDRQVYYMRGTVSGDTVVWEPALNLSPGSSVAVWPAIAVSSNGDVHVVWGEEIGTNVLGVDYTRYNAASSTWQSPATAIATGVHVNDETPMYPEPRVEVHEEDDRILVCVSWHGFAEGENAEEVHIRCSEDGGQAWWPTARNVSRTPGPEQMSIWPSMAFDAGGKLHFVWRESLSVNTHRIYYAQSLDQTLYLPSVFSLW